MSNTLAIATVSAILQARVTALLNEHGMLGMAVSTDHPSADPAPGVYIKLYQITPNAALRNEDLPTRRAEGSVSTRPRLAIELHYLFSFVGDATTFDPERLAGLVLTDLHARPTLTKPAIVDFVASLATDNPLKLADLGDQLERVKFTPRAVDLENLSRLWAMMHQSFYGLSVAFDASVVLLDGEARARQALPVAVTRVGARPSARPRIVRIHADGGSEPVVALGQTLVIEGSGFTSESTSLRIDGKLFPLTAAAITPTRIVFPLTPALGLRAGVLALEVVPLQDIGDGVTPELRESGASNAVAFAHVPLLGAASVTSLGAGRLDVRIGSSPLPRPGQLVQLELDVVGGGGGATSKTYRLDGTAVVFTVSAAPSGVALFRVSIDGARSIPSRDASGRYVAPTVTLP